MSHPRLVRSLLAFVVALDLVLAWAVARGGLSGWLSLTWLLVVGLLVAVAAVSGPQAGAGDPARDRRWSVLAVVAAVLLPLGPRIANLSMTLSHPDEFALAWFSHEFDLARTTLFGPIPDSHVWNHQMPGLYFALQKVFFLLVGQTPMDVKLSTMPYVAVTAGALFFFARRMMGTVPGLAAVGIYAVLAPSVYADTFATTISASMAFFLVFFAASVANVRRQELGTALLAGVACAFCLLAAPTSYLAVPLLFAFSGLSLRCLPFRTVLRGLGVSLAAFLLVLLPFFCGAARRGNFFAERLVRVAPIVAPLFGITPPPEEVARSHSDLAAKWALQTSYFWRNDAGGCCGFNFGQAALLDPVTGVLALVGLVAGFRLRTIRLEWTMAVSVVATSLFALGFANPPPMITRYSLLFPFVALFLAAPVALALDWPGAPKALRWGAAAILLAVLAAANVVHFRSAVARDTAGGRGEYEDVKVALYLQRMFPGHAVKVAAFGGFHLGYTLHFFLPGVDIEVDYHQQLLERMVGSHDYVYVVLFPDEFNRRFLTVDPTGVVVTGVSRNYSLFVSRNLARSAGLVSAEAPAAPGPEAPSSPPLVSAAPAG